MPVQFIGYIASHYESEIHPYDGPAIDTAHVERVAKVHDAVGFDRALVAFSSRSPESILVAAHAASVTKNLKFLIAHRPGFTQPTLAARQLATLDQFTGGRVAVHIISGGNDLELRQDGDFSVKEDRYARTDEYLDIVKAEWTSATPFDYNGKYYRVEQGFGNVKPAQTPHIPVFFGGSSDVAIPVAGKHADVYALFGEPVAQVREVVQRVRAEAAKHGRKIGFSLSLRPILADTEENAWARANRILERVKDLRQSQGLQLVGHEPQSKGSERLLDAAAKGQRLDKRLWTGVAAVSGARGNSTSLVGTPEQVADALLDYYDVGIDHFLIRGFDPLEDALDYGVNLLPRVRALAAERDHRKTSIAS